MDNESHSDALTTEELAALVQKKNGAPLAHFALHLGGLVVTAAVAVAASDPWVRAAAAVVCAPLWAGIFATMHETMHLTAFRSKTLNEIAFWSSALPIFFVPTAERELHFEHHRFTHDPARDPELSVDGENVARGPQNLAVWLASASGLPLIIARLIMLPALLTAMPIVLADVPTAPKLVRMPWLRARLRVRAVVEAWLCLAVYAAVVVACVHAAPRLSFLELGAAFFAGQAILAVYQQCEHRGLEPAGDIFARTRSMKTNAVVRWLFWNMPWHAEHHAYPAVPYHALGALHERLKARLVHADHGFVALTLMSLRFKARRPSTSPSP